MTHSQINHYPLTVPKQTPLNEIIELMSRERQSCKLEENLSATENDSCVIVVEEGKPIGIFTERDLVRLAALETPIEATRVEELMTTKLITVEEKDAEDLFYAIDILRHHHIRHLPIVDQTGLLVGVLTRESIRKQIQPADLPKCGENAPAILL